MKEKLTAVTGMGIAVLVILTLVFYLYAKETMELFDVVSVLIIAILTVAAIYLIVDRVKNIRAGLPAQDERLKQIGYKAGYYGFIAAIWSAVGSNLGYNILFDRELRGGMVVAAVVFGAGLVFMISFLYLARKGNEI